MKLKYKLLIIHIVSILNVQILMILLRFKVKECLFDGKFTLKYVEVKRHDVSNLLSNGLKKKFIYAQRNGRTERMVKQMG